MAFVVLCLFALASAAPGADDYKLGPDSMEHPDVPKGKVTKHSWTSQIFPETTRDYWVYVPAQYDAKARPASWSSRTARTTPGQRASSASRSSSTT